jgi:molybdopterin-binding protein
MRISARNQIKGTIREVRKGATTAHVLVDIGDSDIGGHSSRHPSPMNL